MSKTLLLADGSSTIQRVVELTFAEEDIRVVSVDDGEQALQSIERDEPDIVLVDVGMPRLDGYSVSAHVKTSPRWQHIPVLLLAGAFEPIDEDRAQAARCDGVLVKPFEPRLLVSRVQELLEAAHARQTAAASLRATAFGGDGTASPGDPGRVVLAWPKLDRTDGRDRPAPPSFDVADLDRHLAAVTPAPVVATIPASAVVPEPPAPEQPLASVSSARPAAAVPAPVSRPVAAAPTQTMASAGGSLGSKVSLAAAFAALLAAEQSVRSADGVPASLGQSAVEEAVRRVLLGDGAVRKIVLETTERMVKEEIDRIKSLPGPPGEGGPLTE